MTIANNFVPSHLIWNIFNNDEKLYGYHSRFILTVVFKILKIPKATFFCSCPIHGIIFIKRITFIFCIFLNFRFNPVEKEIVRLSNICTHDIETLLKPNVIVCSRIYIFDMFNFESRLV